MLEERAQVRIDLLEKEMQEFITMANNRVAIYQAIIAELKQLLNPTEAEAGAGPDPQGGDSHP